MSAQPDRQTLPWMDSYTIDKAPECFHAWRPPVAFSFTGQDLVDVANRNYPWAMITDDGHLYIEHDDGDSSARYCIEESLDDIGYARRRSPELTKAEVVAAQAAGVPWLNPKRGESASFDLGGLQQFDPTRYAMPPMEPGMKRTELPKCLHAWDARAEYDVCTVCGIRRIPQGTVLDGLAATQPSGPEVDLLTEAISIITGSRAENYGKAENSFGMIADLWTTYLDNRTGDRDMITGHDVAMMMCLLKIARQTYAPKRDNLVDLAGYAALAQRITETGR